MTEVIRSESPYEAITALILIYILAIFVLLFAGLTILGLIFAWSPTWLSLWIGALFFGLAAMVDVYRRNFQPDEMVVKTRLPKIVPRRELRE